MKADEVLSPLQQQGANSYMTGGEGEIVHFLR